MMRPQRCAQDHELVWLTTRLAVCPECDVDEFIYHYDGTIDRLVRCMDHAVRASVRAAREDQARLALGNHHGLRPLVQTSIAIVERLLWHPVGS